MKATVKSSRSLKGIYAASAIGKIGDFIFIAPDNSNKIHLFDCHMQWIRDIELFPHSTAEKEIAKKEKADVECFLSFSVEGNKYVLLVGSGSFEEKRDSGFLLSMDSIGEVQSKTISLTLLYNLFRQIFSINIEGVICCNQEIIFFSRGNEKQSNLMFTIDEQRFYQFIFNGKKELQLKSNYEIATPLINGFATGITEVFYINKKIFATAAAEHTLNSFDDGPIEGSMVLALEKIHNQLVVSDAAIVMNTDGTIFKKKIEGVLVQSMDKTIAKVWAVTDNDGGDSELLEVEIIM
jgi:hypothetical protein